nr:hypothetical protein Hi04_10k_c1556_00031 [uncultured bacterium]
MAETLKLEPDSTAVRTALWRALHVEIDAPPHVLEDRVGLQLAAPEAGWQGRPDMHPQWTAPFRASIVARARFIEDLIAEQADRGVRQYVILGAGLDTFAQRRPELASRLRVFEIDRPGPQAWKRGRLLTQGFGIPDWLRLVPVDFEQTGTLGGFLEPPATTPLGEAQLRQRDSGDSWRAKLTDAGFEPSQAAVVASTGVSMYLSREANAATLREIAAMARGSTVAMTFLVPPEMAHPSVRPGIERAIEGARASGTPFVSLFAPAEMLEMARAAGFRSPRHVSADDLAQRYFANRADGLRPPANGEELLVATI